MIAHKPSCRWRRFYRHWRNGIFSIEALVLIFAALLLISLPIYASDAAQFDHPVVKAQGEQTAVLTVTAFGRYALAAKSNQGVALQLVDSMAGPGELYGAAGQEDGRIDQFLDRGRYKLVTLADNHGAGDVQLSVRAFQELHSKPPLLVENRIEKSALNDYEQRSYWLDIPVEQDVAIEAAGRHLTDLRLWRDGTWLVAAEPALAMVEPRPNRPLRVCRLTTRLAPGMYRLTTYGGRAVPWTEQSEERPLFLRLGIPKLGNAGRQRFTVSEFGSDRYLIPRQANYFRLELTQPGLASLTVGDYDAANAFDNDGALQDIRKETQPPVAEIRHDGSTDWHVVTVTASAGHRFVLQQFEERNQYGFQGGGDYWISTLHGGHSGDAIGASAVLTQRAPGLAKETYLADRAVNLDQASHWQRRFNLLQDATLFFNVRSTGKYRLENTGSRARFRFEPFVTSRPEKYRPPPFRDSGYTFDLEAGLYVLVLKPEDQGIVDLTLTPEAPDDKPVKPVKTAGLAAATFALQNLRADSQYHVYVNQQPGVASGLIVRRMPIDLSEPLPITASTRETFTLPVTLPVAGTLRANSESGEDLHLVIDGANRGAATPLAAGHYTLTLPPQATETHYSLVFTPLAQESNAALPELPDANLPASPNFAELSVNQPRFFDLQRGSAITYRLNVPTAALYRLESEGLLHTQGTLRTQIQPQLFSANANGTGRNFLIQQYLREGDYQITVAAQDRSQGHGGLRLAQAPLQPGGELHDDVPAHATLPAGQALLYHFRIPQRGHYRLQAWGLDRLLNVRVEDADGWPIITPGIAGDIAREFAPGMYRLLVLPEAAPVRALTRLTARVEPVPLMSGHGPHTIALNSTGQLLWEEQPAPAPRTLDQWQFDLPAAAEVTLQLTNDMVGELYRRDDTAGATQAQVTAVRPWQGQLASGAYRLETRQRRPNNRVPYKLTVTSRELLTGQARDITAPTSIPVSIGKPGLVEFASLGNSDVQARLYDATGKLVAQNDDAPDDWNFQLATWLNTGVYRLDIAAVHQSTANTTISLLSPSEIIEAPLSAGQTVRLQDAAVHVYPLQLAQQDFIGVWAQGAEPAGLLLEVRNDAQQWQTVADDLGKSASVAAPLQRERQYRLRAWSSERRGTPIALRFATTVLAEQDEDALRRGRIKMQALGSETPTMHVAAIRLDAPGLLRIHSVTGGSAWTDDWHHPMRPLTGDPLVTTSHRLWLVQRTTQSEPLQSTRLLLGRGAPLRFTIPPTTQAQLDMGKREDAVQLLLARAPFGTPALAMTGVVADAVGITAHSAVMPLTQATTPSALRIRNGLDSNAPLDLSVQAITFPKATQGPLTTGITDGALNAGQSRAFQLAAGTKTLRIALTPGLAAVLTADGQSQTTLWADEHALTETLSSAADELILLNSAAAPRPYSLELLPGNAAVNAPTLVSGNLFGQQFATPGALRLPIRLTPSGQTPALTLRIRGTAEALFVADDGALQTGSDIPITGNGTLRLQHAPGPLLAWLDKPLQTAAPEITVTPPQRVPLAGREQVLRFNLATPSLLSLQTPVPLATWFSTPPSPPHVALHPAGIRESILLPAGETRLWLKPIGNASLDGELTVLALGEHVITDGTAESTVLAPGSGRLYRFTVTAAGHVGIGIRASSDLVTGRLYDNTGQPRGEGLVQMPKLTAGQYYLAVQTPLDSPPITVQPLLVGLTAPPRSPPGEIVRRFVEAKAVSAPALIYVPPQPGQDSVIAPAPESASQTDDETAARSPDEETE